MMNRFTSSAGEVPRFRFVGITYAGWSTRQSNLARNVASDDRIEGVFTDVTGWKENGLFERVGRRSAIAGKLRAGWEAKGLTDIVGADVIWTSAMSALLPYRMGPLARLPWPPVVGEFDWTVEQRESMADHYYDRPGATGDALADMMATERRYLSHIDAFIPWSNWAADGLRRQGIDDERIHVVHPGLRLDDWAFVRREAPVDRPIRLLFVGGDFARKGGDLLIDAVTKLGSERFVLDVVTRDELTPPPGVAVHRCEPNTDELRQRFIEADIFVMPTRADCFGLVLVEAMAMGLPVIASDVGGVRDIVDDGVNGWCVQPSLDSVVAALENAEARAAELPEIGARGRSTAEERFDGVRNDARVVDIMLDLHRERQA